MLVQGISIRLKLSKFKLRTLTYANAIQEETEKPMMTTRSTPCECTSVTFAETILSPPDLLEPRRSKLPDKTVSFG